jgi:hypothetical protein
MVVAAFFTMAESNGAWWRYLRRAAICGLLIDGVGGFKSSMWSLALVSAGNYLFIRSGL